MQASTLMQKWFDEVWHNANESAIDELLHTDAIIHGLDTAPESKGPEAFKPFYQNLRKTFPKVYVDLDYIVDQEDVSVAYCKVTATTEAGQDVQFNGLVTGKFKDGKLIEGWNAFDFLSMQEQLKASAV